MNSDVITQKVSTLVPELQDKHARMTGYQYNGQDSYRNVYQHEGKVKLSGIQNGEKVDFEVDYKDVLKQL